MEGAQGVQLRDVQEFIDLFIARKIIIGPDHFILGDGFGNPGMHAGLFVEARRFYEAMDLHSECIRRIIEQLGQRKVDLIVTPDDQSGPTARLLARYLAGEYRVPKIPVYSMESDQLPAEGGAVLIHDDVINRGRQAQEVLARLEDGPFEPFAISALFTRIVEKQILGMPIVAAVDRVMAAVPESECPLCKEGKPINPHYGKGAIYLAMRGDTQIPIKIPM
jgi:hypothetical protein